MERETCILDLTWYTTHGTIDIVRKVPEDVKTLQVNRTLLLVQLANSPPSADTGQLQHSQFNCRTVQNLQKTQTLRKCARKLTRVCLVQEVAFFFCFHTHVGYRDMEMGSGADQALMC